MSTIKDAISVVIPTYNRAHLIKESLESVLAQTLQPHEIIVVDDFSTDNTEEVVASLNSPLIKYVKNQRKKGANGARNTGIIMAQGEFIAFHDSDDVWLPKKLELQKNKMHSDPSLDMCFCCLNRKISEQNKYIRVPKRDFKQEQIRQELLKNNFISTQTIFIKRNVAEVVLFDEALMRLQDWDFVLRLLEEFKIDCIADVLVIQNISADSISNNNRLLEAYDYMFKKHQKIVNYGTNNKIYCYMLNSDKTLIQSIHLFLLRVIRRVFM